MPQVTHIDTLALKLEEIRIALNLADESFDITHVLNNAELFNQEWEELRKNVKTFSESEIQKLIELKAKLDVLIEEILQMRIDTAKTISSIKGRKSKIALYNKY